MRNRGDEECSRKVIVHNSISLDGSLVHLDVNLPLHYQIAGKFHADLHLVGSNTAKHGIDTFLTEIPSETEEDFTKPTQEGLLWAIPDTTGKLHGLLHIFRQSEYCQDIVILISETTPTDYVRYMTERAYDHYVVGEDKCNLKRALELLHDRYHVNTILTDTGCILSNLLIHQGLVSEISVLIHPVIVGKNAYHIFGTLEEKLNLELRRQESLEKDYVWCVYQVQKL